MTTLTANGWKNKNGTSQRTCSCGSWQKHWIKHTKKTWPPKCSAKGCRNAPTVGGHVINSSVTGEKIVPLCDSCNKLSGSFNIEGGVSLANATQD